MLIIIIDEQTLEIISSFKQINKLRYSQSDKYLLGNKGYGLGSEETPSRCRRGEKEAFMYEISIIAIQLLKFYIQTSKYL